VAVGLLLVLSTEGTAGRRQPERILLHKKGVLVTSEWAIDGREFELLGRVSARCRSISLTESDRDLGVRCSGSLISPALALGADAVVGLHVLPTPFTESDLSSKFASGVSGIAVRTLEPGQPASKPRARFVVAVLPLEVPDSLVNSAKERDQLERLMQDVAMASVEERGYYAERAESSDTDVSQLAAMPDSAWTRAFGSWTGAVLSTRLVTATGSSTLMRGKQEVTVEARLLSADSARVIWSRMAEGHFASWKANTQISPLGVVYTVPDPHGTKAARVEISLGRAVRNAISGAPPAE
jgi:hypothetical protein